MGSQPTSQTQATHREALLFPSTERVHSSLIYSLRVPTTDNFIALMRVETPFAENRNHRMQQPLPRRRCSCPGSGVQNDRPNSTDRMLETGQDETLKRHLCKPCPLQARGLLELGLQRSLSTRTLNLPPLELASSHKVLA
ncbi:hypothetical protein H920_05499 [Fukomys damarensis]|uniref:Uncharacterized protein n=1 Tax=Fukomys damarensis TaxID=885580 RepID=A0A091ED92_FUKDA|nr:hypothetical protein H920_05499 [Fukomys damarensis]